MNQIWNNIKKSVFHRKKKEIKRKPQKNKQKTGDF